MDGIARAGGGGRGGAALRRPARRPRRRGARRARGGEGTGRGRPGRAAARALRGGARTGRRRRPAAEPRRGSASTASGTPNGSPSPSRAPPSSTRRSPWSTTRCTAGRCRSTLEGTPRRALPLVEAGTTRAVAHDRRRRPEAGAGSTGHGLPGGATFGPIPHNIRLLADPGVADAGATVAAGPVSAGVTGAVGDPDTAALVAGMRRGLLVSDFWYTRVLDPKQPGGHRVDPQRGVAGRGRRADRGRCATCGSPSRTRGRWGRGGCSGLGRAPVRQPGRVDGSWYEAPSLRLASWHFTGGASG